MDIQLQLVRARQLQMSVSNDEIDRQVDALKEQNQISGEQLEQMLKSRGMTPGEATGSKSARGCWSPRSSTPRSGHAS